MSQATLQGIINNFDLEEFKSFFRKKNRAFKPTPKESSQESPIYPDNQNFEVGKKLGIIPFDDSELIIVSFKTKCDLSQRSGKKEQYEVGKNVLKEKKVDAGIFIFHDDTGNFRFSLIYSKYLEKKRDWNSFRRFTYFVSPDLTNKTFLRRIGDGNFSSLEKIKVAFAVEPVTEEFYEAIANWYFWAVQDCRFPKAAEEEDNGRKVAVLRLITRIIFIWFMRERGLVSKELFEEEWTQHILVNTDKDKSTYYHAILQNLFFATLSTKIDERQFRSDIRGHKGYNPDFGNQYVFRYHNLFSNPEEMTNYFSDIPFLNGGLFECLDDGKNKRYIDGFTRRSEYQPVVPNYLFFSGEKTIDLNVEFGTKGKSYRVQGLLNTLSSFNFTIDENSPDDADIALDPELLGRVFENLLAEFNPETSTTARKKSGSYYTPRPIVSYMVTESLKEYFRTHFSETQDIDRKLEKLFSIEECNPFSESETEKFVELIEGVRIVDPAVGSGAFPMGALNRMVFILNKVDPKNKLWKQAQLEAANAITDPRVRRDTKAQIEGYFTTKNADYGRKLYLIQKCIYGVDSQQIAVEIAKLRFFISLLVDEKIDKAKSNWDIQPLPNLDFKIMQGNSMLSEFLGIDFDKGPEQQEQPKMFLEKEDLLIKEYERKKIDFQNEPDRYKKITLKKEIEDLMIEIFEARFEKQKTDYLRRMEKIKRTSALLANKKQIQAFTVEEKQKLYKETGFDLENIGKQLREFISKNKARPFFPWKLYFAEVFHEKQGFDVVIGNPPYGYRNVLTAEDKKHFRKKEKIEFSSGDSAELFSKKSFDNLVAKGGVLTFILPKKSLYGDSWEGWRKDYLSKYNLLFLLDAGKAFKKVLLEQAAFGLVKRDTQRFPVTLAYLTKNYELNEFAKKGKVDLFTGNRNAIQIYQALFDPQLLEKIQSRKSSNVSAEGDLGLAIGKKFFSNELTDYKLLKGIDIDRWRIKSHRYLKNKRNLDWNDARKFLRPKVICQRVIAYIDNPFPHIKITACYDTEGIIIANTLTAFRLPTSILDKFWLAYLNSSFVSWYAHNFIYSRAVRTMDLYDSYIRQIPIPQGVVNNPELQKPFIDLVSKILMTTNETEISKYEKEIDYLVYKLYDLTKEEIAIIESSRVDGS